MTLDARLTRQMSVGMKLYVRELVRRLPLAAPDLSFRVVSNAQLETSGAVDRVALSDAAAANGGLAEQFGLKRRLSAAQGSLVHFMSVYAPRTFRNPHVCTIHDLIHLRFPHYFSWKVPLYYRLVVGPVARSARLVITDAQATIADLEGYLGIAPQRVRVVPLAPSDAFYLDDDSRRRRATQARERFKLELPFFVYAGNHRPHKNLATLVAAWRRLEATADLVITEDGPLEFEGSQEKAGGRLVRTGHVGQEDIVGLYAASAAAVQPSLFEGFGLTVLEAMAAGTPCIVARTPVLVEVAADAALSFAPNETDELVLCMQKVLGDPALADRLRAAGRKRAADFSWRSTAAQTAAVYREALGAS